ncbi:MAG: ferritin-like domain-containing protein [Alphaproteobacteria bacterium]|nr:ferritin-like domain-containing protein [Alphaproteobacteria bacterium]
MAGPNKYWSLDDIPWDRFDPAKVDREIVEIVKAAALVEFNGGSYAAYLNGVFAGDAEFSAAAEQWGAEEVQHGRALSRWARLADPSFDFEAAFARFSEKIKLPVGIDVSVRGSRCGELVARCIVEVGTSSYYSALRDTVEEPLLRDICRRIAQDEIRHYGLFYRHMCRYVEIEGLTRLDRMRVAFARIGESEDDELAYAFHAANRADQPYDRKRCRDAYMKRAWRCYKPDHVERATTLVLKVVGLKPHGRVARVTARAARVVIDFRTHHLAAA